MQFTFTVTVEVTRESGKFAGRDEVAEQLMEAIEQADPGSVEGVGADSESMYTVDSWDVEEQEAPKRKPQRKAKAKATWCGECLGEHEPGQHTAIRV